MPKSIISEGKTSIEAIEKGLKELNVSKNQVEIRIIEEKKKSFFNILEPHVVKVEITLKEDATETTHKEKHTEKREVREEDINSFTTIWLVKERAYFDKLDINNNKVMIVNTNEYF